MTSVTIGLSFPGTCEQAFTLYKSVFGVEFSAFTRYGDDPFTAGGGTPPKDRDKYIAYAEMSLGGVVITGMDETLGQITAGNNVGIVYEPDSKEEADRVFEALAQGGSKTSPNTDYPWGYCGALIDRFGVRWGFFVRARRK